MSFGPSRQDAIRAGIVGDRDILFWRAIHNDSTQAPFALISVPQPDGSIATYATTASFVLGAIHMEHGIPYTAEGSSRAKEIALATPGHLFRFTNPAAQKNVERYYDETVLSEVRQALARYSKAELLSGFSGMGSLHSTYNQYEHPKAHAYEFAVAHVLLERGLLPSMHSRILTEE